MTIQLPRMICLRVTRNCNAHCRFCLAPPNGMHPGLNTLVYRIDWLLAHGVRTIHFCGGEPTLSPSLPELLIHTHTQGGKNKLTTNALTLSPELLKILFKTKTEVKVSLHGDREFHDNIMGVESFDRATANLRRLIIGGVSTSIQTTVVKNQEWVVDWMIQFCLAEKIRRLSIMPFIPRGYGRIHHDTFGFLPGELRQLHDLVKKKRREISARLDIRWLDFSVLPFYVVDADGAVVIERATETMDKRLCYISGG